MQASIYIPVRKIYSLKFSVLDDTLCLQAKGFGGLYSIAFCDGIVVRWKATRRCFHLKRIYAVVQCIAVTYPTVPQNGNIPRIVFQKTRNLDKQNKYSVGQKTRGTDHEEEANIIYVHKVYKVNVNFSNCSTRRLTRQWEDKAGHSCTLCEDKGLASLPGCFTPRKESMLPFEERTGYGPLQILWN